MIGWIDIYLLLPMESHSSLNQLIIFLDAVVARIQVYLAVWIRLFDPVFCQKFILV